MNYLESKIREARQWTEEHNPTTVTEMNHAVEEHFVIRGDGRNHQPAPRLTNPQVVVNHGFVFP
jgi:hypothetical protein